MKTRPIIIAVGLALVVCRSYGAAAEDPAAPRPPVNDMVFVAAGERTVGTSLEERQKLATRFGCDPTWLNDDLQKRNVRFAPFWMDRFPVSNEKYRVFVEATGARNPWPEGAFPAGHGDHPVVGVSFQEAEAYARWIGKRLPTVEQWEVAAQPGTPAVFPWGGDWPGPARQPSPNAIPDWRSPATERLGTARHGRSMAGMEDFIGQVCEWTSSTTQHHGAPFAQLKGASWLHEDPVNFRTAASFWAMSNFHTPWIGFRCAQDEEQTPPSFPGKESPANASSPFPLAPKRRNGGGMPAAYPLREMPKSVGDNLLNWSRQFLEGPRPAHSRGFVLHVPNVGDWPVALFLAEALTWNDSPLVGWYREGDPPLQTTTTESGSAVYRMDFDDLTVTFQFVSGADFVDLLTTVTNNTSAAGKFAATSCFSLMSHPVFYDCEMLRTYQWTGAGEFVSVRQVPRLGECVRWIAPSEFDRYGGVGRPGVMAVVSRDRQWTFASVRFEDAAAYQVQGNPWLNCLHTDSPVTVAARSSRTTKQRLYFLNGGLQELQLRLDHDGER